MRRLLPTGLATAALVGLAASASAHDLFLKLRTYFVPPNTPIVIQVLNGTFVNSENSVQRNRLRDLTLVARGARTALDSTAWVDTAKTRSTLRLTTGAQGTYVVGASTLPRLIGLTAKEFNEYLIEDGLPDVLAMRKATGEISKPARERYHKHIKAVLQVGDARTNDYSVALGYPAELIPLTNPYDARVGQKLGFRCLVDGAPSAGQYVLTGVDLGSGKVSERAYVADSAGVVNVAITRRGKWYVKFIRMEPVRDSVDYESKWASLTFEIR